MKKRTSLTRIIGVAVLAAVAGVIAIATFASADDIHAEVSNSGQGNPNQATTGTNYPVRFWIGADNDGEGGAPDCNASDGTPAKITLQFPANSGLAADPTELEVDECGNDPQDTEFVINICPTKAFSGNVTIQVADDDSTDTYTFSPNNLIEMQVTGPDVADCGGGGGGGGGNQAPTVSSPAADANGDEGDTLSTSGAFTDPDGDTLTLTADETQGTFTDNGDGTWDWEFATNDNYSGTITVTATDPGGETASDEFNYSSANVNPDITNLAVDSANSASVCQPTITFGIDDPGTADTWAHGVNWDAGDPPDLVALLATIPEEDDDATGYTSSTSRSVPAPGQYSSTGDKEIAVGVKDDDEGSDADSITHTVPNEVTDPDNVAFGPPIVINGNGKGLFKSGSTIPVKIRASVCGFSSDGSYTPVTGLNLKVVGLFFDSEGTGDAEVQPNSNVKANSDGWMRESDDQYIYNYATPKGSPTGSYFLLVEEWTARTGGTLVRTYVEDLALKRG